MAAGRDDGCIRAWARDLDPTHNEATFSSDDPVGSGIWTDYLKGVLSAMRERGLHTCGADLLITSELPRDSGLSSSAALCVAASNALLAVAGVSLARDEIADLAHRAESHFVGTQCGILDPYAVVFGRRDRALRIDCRSREWREIPFPARELVILIADSGVRRSLASASDDVIPAYRLRVSECHDAFAAARAAGVARPGAESLRDLDEGHLPALERALAARLFRRARHVILENERVDAFCRALSHDGTPDLTRLGGLLRAGQASLRDDFEASIPELDFLCDSADRQAGVYGSRLTGAGFGGCTLHLVTPERVASVARDLAEAFESQFGRRPPILEARAADGATISAL